MEKTMTPTPAAVEAAIEAAQEIHACNWCEEKVTYEMLRDFYFKACKAIEALRTHQPPTDEQNDLFNMLLEYFELSTYWVINDHDAETERWKWMDKIEGVKHAANKRVFNKTAPALPVELEGLPDEVYITKYFVTKSIPCAGQLRADAVGTNKNSVRYIRADAQSPARVNREFVELAEYVAAVDFKFGANRKQAKYLAREALASAEQLERGKP